MYDVMFLLKKFKLVILGDFIVCLEDRKSIVRFDDLVFQSL